MSCEMGEMVVFDFGRLKMSFFSVCGKWRVWGEEPCSLQGPPPFRTCGVLLQLRYLQCHTLIFGS